MVDDIAIHRRAARGPAAIAFACALALGLGGGAPAHAAEGATFIVVPQAESAGHGRVDPPLNAHGLRRARALARRLAGAPLRAVYATGLRSAQQTVRPTARRRHVAVTIYDAAMPASGFAAQLRARHPDGIVLVVGAGDAVPSLVAALCTCRIAVRAADDHDALYTIHVDADGRGVLDVGRQSGTTH